MMPHFLRKYGFWFLIALGIVFLILGIYLSTKAVVIIEWSTSSELDTAGFMLYRKEVGREQPILITDEMIHSSPDPLLGGDYKYIDHEAKPDELYVYSLQEVTKDGEMVQIGEEEIRAKKGGVFEIILSGFFLGLGLVGILLVRNRD